VLQKLALDKSNEGASLYKLKLFSRDLRLIKNVPDFMFYPSTITFARVFLYAYLSGNNSYNLDEKGFLEACTKYGLTSPIPFFTKRLALYGNTVDLSSCI
jgi:hypothetical protein